VRVTERVFERLAEALLEQLRGGVVHLRDVVRDLALAVVGDHVRLLGHRLHHHVADDAGRLLALLAEHVDETGGQFERLLVTVGTGDRCRFLSLPYPWIGTGT